MCPLLTIAATYSYAGYVLGSMVRVQLTLSPENHLLEPLVSLVLSAEVEMLSMMTIVSDSDVLYPWLTMCWLQYPTVFELKNRDSIWSDICYKITGRGALVLGPQL